MHLQEVGKDKEKNRMKSRMKHNFRREEIKEFWSWRKRVHLAWIYPTFYSKSISCKNMNTLVRIRPWNFRNPDSNTHGRRIWYRIPYSRIHHKSGSALLFKTLQDLSPQKLKSTSPIGGCRPINVAEISIRWTNGVSKTWAWIMQCLVLLSLITISLMKVWMLI